MLIHFDGGSIDTDTLVGIERNPDLSLCVVSETPEGQELRTYSGLAAEQIWCQITEHAETIAEGELRDGH